MTAADAAGAGADPAPAPAAGARPPRRESSRAKALMVLALFAVLAFAVADSVAWYRPVGGAEDALALGEALFGRYVVAFEVLGVLLTGALLGAMFLAMKEERA